jgi:hypothetical protein
MKAAEDYGPAIEKGGEDEQATMHRTRKKHSKRGSKRKGRRKGRR